MEDNNNNSNVPKALDVLWTPSQAAKYFGVSLQTIWRWVSTGKVFDKSKIVILGSRNIRIPRSEIERITSGKKDELKEDSQQ